VFVWIALLFLGCCCLLIVESVLGDSSAQLLLRLRLLLRCYVVVVLRFCCWRIVRCVVVADALGDVTLCHVTRLTVCCTFVRYVLPLFVYGVCFGTCWTTFHTLLTVSVVGYVVFVSPALRCARLIALPLRSAFGRFYVTFVLATVTFTFVTTFPFCCTFRSHLLFLLRLPTLPLPFCLLPLPRLLPF